MNIRPGQAKEVLTFQQLNQAVFVDNYQYDDDLDLNWALSVNGKKYFAERLTNPKACCLLAEEHGIPIGYIVAAPKEVEYVKSKYFEVENMGVIPEYRSKGIGKQLMNQCLSWAKKEGYQRAYVCAYFHNKKAVQFYKDNGFFDIDISLEKIL